MYLRTAQPRAEATLAADCEQYPKVLPLGLPHARNDSAAPPISEHAEPPTAVSYGLAKAKGATIVNLLQY
jgi:hypothetical protein